MTPEELAQPLLAPDEAVARVLAGLEPLPATTLPLDRCLGLVAAEDVSTPRDVPAFANSAMDGYAVRSSDVAGASPGEPVVLRVVDEIPAGGSRSEPVAPGTAVKIMTGAPVPAGADAVVPWEDTDRGAGEVAVRVAPAPGRHVRPAGEDLRAGTKVITAGTELGPAHVGVLALVGAAEARVRPRPRLAVLSTGDELVAAGTDLGASRVYDSNGPLLGALCVRAGAEVIATDLLGDDPARIEDWLEGRAGEADLIVTSGGASVGEHDWIRDVLGRTGGVEMWRVSMRPGKPVVFGRAHGTPVLGLPGNPGSVFACAHVFVGPAIRRLGGRDPSPRWVPARLGGDVPGDPKRTFYCPVTLRDGVAGPVPSRSSQALSNVLSADGFALVPPGGLSEGAEVRVELLG